MQHDARASELRKWVERWLERHRQDWGGVCSMPALSGDASFRRYFRVVLQEHSLVAVDAPPEHENNPAFVAIATALRAHGIKTPEVLAWQEEAGFLLLEDLGDQLLLPVLTPDRVQGYYHQAMQILLTMQECTLIPGWKLPFYDSKRLLEEMRLFPDWFIRRYLTLNMNVEDHGLLENAMTAIVAELEALPVVFVHRDYHARNIMLLESGAMGVLDFQDAVLGPFNYDLISLLRDAYVSWPREQVRAWMLHFAQALRQQGRMEGMSDAQFLVACDWMSLQRHLKILGIFARLCIRDQKPGYLRDMPLVLSYVLDQVERLPALAVFGAWLRQRVVPRFVEVSGRPLPELA